MRARVLAAIVAASFANPLLAGVAAAQNTNKAIDDATEAARNAMDKVLRALGAAVGAIPQYEAPEVLPNGDIIIRRKPPAVKPDEPAKPPTPGQQRT
jgi:hypothetical protein